MNLNDRILWHFLENDCKYIATVSRGFTAPGSAVWIYSIPYGLHFPLFCCVIAIKEHWVFTRIDYGTRESTSNHIEIVGKEWRRRSFNVFRLMQWIESNKDLCVKTMDEIRERQAAEAESKAKNDNQEETPLVITLGGTKKDLFDS